MNASCLRNAVLKRFLAQTSCGRTGSGRGVSSPFRDLREELSEYVSKYREAFVGESEDIADALDQTRISVNSRRWQG